MEFTKELKEAWLTALKSGDYKKTESGDLYKKGCHCVLGVLCRVSGMVKDDKELQEIDSNDSQVLYNKFQLLLGEINVTDVYKANDKHEGDNFKAAIEVVEELETTG